MMEHAQSLEERRGGGLDELTGLCLLSLGEYMQFLEPIYTTCSLKLTPLA